MPRDYRHQLSAIQRRQMAELDASRAWDRHSAVTMFRVEITEQVMGNLERGRQIPLVESAILPPVPGKAGQVRAYWLTEAGRAELERRAPSRRTKRENAGAR